MLTEPLPIEIFVSSRFTEKDIVALIENWRVEKDDVQKMLANYFKEMGIYSVTPQMEAKAKKTMLFWLQNAPEIYTMVRKAEEQDVLRRQSRKPG